MSEDTEVKKERKEIRSRSCVCFLEHLGSGSDFAGKARKKVEAVYSSAKTMKIEKTGKSFNRNCDF